MQSLFGMSVQRNTADCTESEQAMLSQTLSVKMTQMVGGLTAR